MAFKYIKQTALVAALLHIAAAQQKSNIVPEDLKAGFKSSGTEMQASYTNEAVNGFKDGTLFTKDAVSKEPTFAMGDSSGITPSTLYTIIMLDTTCPNKRVLHYARSNFKNNFDITNIDTKTAPILEYKAPGSLSETGDGRQYSFLMYLNPQRKVIDALTLPADGEAFDAKKFKDDNGFQDPAAGVGMVVNLGGTADCGGEAPAAAPSSLPTPQPARSSGLLAPRPTGGVVSSQAAAAASSSAAVPVVSSAAGSASGAPNLPVASSVVQSVGGGIATQTLVLSSAGGVGTGASSTASAGPAEQTVNAAPAVGVEGFGLLAPLVAVAGFVMW